MSKCPHCGNNMVRTLLLVSNKTADSTGNNKVPISVLRCRQCGFTKNRREEKLQIIIPPPKIVLLQGRKYYKNIFAIFYLIFQFTFYTIHLASLTKEVTSREKKEIQLFRCWSQQKVKEGVEKIPAQNFRANISIEPIRKNTSIAIWKTYSYWSKKVDRYSSRRSWHEGAFISVGRKVRHHRNRWSGYGSK